MKLCISNIAWDASIDEMMYKLLPSLGCTGIEIAPTRIIKNKPYEHCIEASQWAKKLYEEYSLTVPSIQSIWYGRSERLFGTDIERGILMEYTKKTVKFAASVGAGNIVFGCPTQRNGYNGDERKYEAALTFFKNIGSYAIAHDVVIGFEANPDIYGTNFANKTSEAIRFIKDVDCDGIRLNLDTASMIYYEEDMRELVMERELVHHVQISEPGMDMIKKRSLHTELREWLENIEYNGYVSVEMGYTADVGQIINCLKYARSVFE